MKSDDLYGLLEAVADEGSFIRFAERLLIDRQRADAQLATADGFQGEWANQSITRFLEAATAWAKDSSFGARPGPKPSNPWRLFADFLWAGRGYE